MRLTPAALVGAPSLMLAVAALVKAPAWRFYGPRPSPVSADWDPPKWDPAVRRRGRRGYRLP